MVGLMGLGGCGEGEEREGTLQFRDRVRRRGW